MAFVVPRSGERHKEGILRRKRPEATLVQDFDNLPAGTVIHEGKTFVIDWLTIETVEGTSEIVAGHRDGRELETVARGVDETCMVGLQLARPGRAIVIEIWLPMAARVYLQLYEDLEHSKYEEELLYLRAGNNLVTGSLPGEKPIHAVAVRNDPSTTLLFRCDNLTVLNAE